MGSLTVDLLRGQVPLENLRACGKRVHRSQAKAARAMELTKTKVKDKKRNTYYCELCNGWHWGHSTGEWNGENANPPL